MQIKYYQIDKVFFKVNFSLERITCIENNEVKYLDFVQNIETISKFKTIKMNQWKNVENTFFLSKDFFWEYSGQKYQTIDKPIEWNQGHAFVFHNGKVWNACYSGNYYPRIFLERTTYAYPVTREVLFEKTIKNLDYNKKRISKWTDIKYCRNFEKID